MGCLGRPKPEFVQADLFVAEALCTYNLASLCSLSLSRVSLLLKAWLQNCDIFSNSQFSAVICSFKNPEIHTFFWVFQVYAMQCAQQQQQQQSTILTVVGGRYLIIVIITNIPYDLLVIATSSVLVFSFASLKI